MRISSIAHSNYENPDPGTHMAVCYSVVDMGTQKGSYEGKATERRILLVTWELAQKMKDGRPFAVSLQYTASLHENATLRKHLESWRGAFKSEDEMQKFDMADMLGSSCMVNLVAKENGKIGVGGVMKMPSGINPLTPANSLMHFDLTMFRQDLFDKLPAWVQKKIVESPEYQNLGKISEANEETSEDDIPFD